MKRSDADDSRVMSSNNHEALNSTSLIQAAQTLEEINQKTLTIRDQFAIAAMQSLIYVYSAAEYESETSERLAKCQTQTAYQIADAMLEARKR